MNSLDNYDTELSSICMSHTQKVTSISHVYTLQAPDIMTNSSRQIYEYKFLVFVKCLLYQLKNNILKPQNYPLLSNTT